MRKVEIDWQMVIRFSEIIKGLPDDMPIFSIYKILYDIRAVNI